MMYPPNIRFNQNSIVREFLLLVVFNYLISLEVQFLGASTIYIPTFSSTLFNHPVKIMGNSSKKMSCKSINTYICNHFSSLSHGLLLCSMVNYCCFISNHSTISFLFGLQNIPLDYISWSRQ